MLPSGLPSRKILFETAFGRTSNYTLFFFGYYQILPNSLLSYQMFSNIIFLQEMESFAERMRRAEEIEAETSDPDE